jgi:predicted GTPase
VEGVGDVKAHELEPPLSNVTDGLLVVDDVPQAARGYDYHGVAVKVMPELSLGDEHGIEELLDSWLVGL